jgi:hypothetical protein
MQNGTNNTEIMTSYIAQSNEQLVCIENFEGNSYSVYAVYVNGEYDRRIKIANTNQGA